MIMKKFAKSIGYAAIYILLFMLFRQQIIDLIWEATGNDVYDHTVTVYMKRIKDKLGSDIFTTIKGVGYRIDTKEAEED